MTVYKLFDSHGRSLTFQGRLVDAVQSRPVRTPRGNIWYQLSAYQSDTERWVVTVAARREYNHENEELLEFYDTPFAKSVEEFLLDFDPAAILPGDVMDACELPENQALVMATDHVFFAAVSCLVDGLKTFERKKMKESPLNAPPKVTDWDPFSPQQDSVVNRIKGWFGI